MLQAGLAIVIFVLCSSYKGYPTMSKLTALKILTIILTVLTGFMILSFVFGIIPAYLRSDNGWLSASIYGAIGVYQTIMIAVCVIACIQGYRAVKNGFLENAAYQDQQKKTNMFFGRFTQGANRQYNNQQSFTTEYSSWQCKSCGKYNNPAHNFCIYCGKPKQ